MRRLRLLLLVALGATGLLALREVEQRAGDLASLQHKIEAYRQMQHDTLRQLYSVSSALAAPDNASLSSALRQINQFGYDLDRVSFVAKDEVAEAGDLDLLPATERLLHRLEDEIHEIGRLLLGKAA